MMEVLSSQKHDNEQPKEKKVTSIFFVEPFSKRRLRKGAAQRSRPFVKESASIFFTVFIFKAEL
jgi:hypothetical protein